MKKDKIVLILSGGLDSTTVLFQLLSENKTVIAISFNYGQKASKELQYAKKTCEKLEVKHEIIDISTLKPCFQSSSIVNEEENDTSTPYNTVVPSRNTILLELATAYAISNNANAVYCGIQKGDYNDYPDTRPIFLDKINSLNQVNNYRYIPIYAPLYDLSKTEVVLKALQLGVPLDETWSCYNQTETPCGECYSCKTREKAIKEAKEILKNV